MQPGSMTGIILLWNVTEEQLEQLFQEAPDSEDAWIGVPAVIREGVEVVGIQFVRTRFLMFFEELNSIFDGDEELARESADAWAGYHPEYPNRLVKFIRADVTDPETMFDPDSWRLPSPRQIFQFGRLLLDAVLVHAALLPDVKVYIYKPERPGLESFYNRIFNKNQEACRNAGFTPIVEIDVEEGGFYGYQRN